MAPDQSDMQIAIIAEQVRRARATRRWTQNELAARVGLSHPTVARAERRDDVSTPALTKVTEVLGLTISVTPDAFR